MTMMTKDENWWQMMSDNWLLWLWDEKCWWTIRSQACKERAAHQKTHKNLYNSSTRSNNTAVMTKDENWWQMMSDNWLLWLWDEKCWWTIRSQACKERAAHQKTHKNLYNSSTRSNNTAMQSIQRIPSITARKKGIIISVPGKHERQKHQKQQQQHPATANWMEKGPTSLQTCHCHCLQGLEPLCLVLIPHVNEELHEKHGLLLGEVGDCVLDALQIAIPLLTDFRVDWLLPQHSAWSAKTQKNATQKQAHNWSRSLTCSSCHRYVHSCGRYHARIWYSWRTRALCWGSIHGTGRQSHSTPPLGPPASIWTESRKDLSFPQHHQWGESHSNDHEQDRTKWTCRCNHPWNGQGNVCCMACPQRGGCQNSSWEHLQCCSDPFVSTDTHPLWSSMQSHLEGCKCQEWGWREGLVCHLHGSAQSMQSEQEQNCKQESNLPVLVKKWEAAPVLGRRTCTGTRPPHKVGLCWSCPPKPSLLHDMGREGLRTGLNLQTTCGRSWHSPSWPKVSDGPSCTQSAMSSIWDPVLPLGCRSIPATDIQNKAHMIWYAHCPTHSPLLLSLWCVWNFLHFLCTEGHPQVQFALPPQDVSGFIVLHQNPVKSGKKYICIIGKRAKQILFSLGQTSCEWGPAQGLEDQLSPHSLQTTWDFSGQDQCGFHHRPRLGDCACTRDPHLAWNQFSWQQPKQTTKLWMCSHSWRGSSHCGLSGTPLSCPCRNQWMRPWRNLPLRRNPTQFHPHNLFPWREGRCSSFWGLELGRSSSCKQYMCGPAFAFSGDHFCCTQMWTGRTCCH